MARTFEKSRYATEHTTANTTWTDTNASSHLTASFATGTWHILAFFDMGAQDNAASTDIRLLIDGTAAHSDPVEFEPDHDDTTNYRYRSCVLLGQLTGDGTSKTVKLQFKTSLTGDPARIKNISIVALSEETGDVWHSDDTNRTNNTGGWSQYGSITPATGTYVLISSAMISNSVSNGTTAARLQFDGADLGYMDTHFDRANKNELFCVISRITGDGVKTLDLDTNDMNNVAGCDGWWCLLLDVSTFEAEVYNNDTVTKQTTSTTYVEHDSKAFNTGGNTEDWLILGGWHSDVNGTSSGAGVSVRFQVDGVTVQEQIGYATSAAYHDMTGVGGQVYTGDGASATLDLDLKSKNGAFTNILGTEGGSWVIALQLTGATEFSPSVLSVTPSFPTPTVSGNINLSPSVLSVIPSFPTPTVSGNINLSPSVLTVAPSFPTPTISSNINLSPSVLTVTPSFPTPTISSNINLSPSVLTVAPSFPTPTVVAGTVALVPSVLSATPSFPTPEIGQPGLLLPNVLSVAPSFPTPTISGSIGLSPSVLSITPVFPTPTMDLTFPLTAAVLTVTPVFPTPSIALGAVGLTSGVITITPVFPTPIVASGAVTLSPSVITVAPTFPTPTVQEYVEHHITEVGKPRVEWEVGRPVAEWEAELLAAGWEVQPAVVGWEDDRPVVAWVVKPGEANWKSKNPRAG